VIIIARPKNEDAPPWCPYYFGLATGDNLIVALEYNKKATIVLINSIPGVKEDFKYAEDKWTTKQVLMHMIDAERYYLYRAFCSSRKVDTNEVSFDREAFGKTSNMQGRTLKDISEEFAISRESTINLFSNMTDEMLDFKGFPNKMVYTARSLGWMAVGHNIHHSNAITEKYLK
jgi:uncharacterized damage-inducible protein DinB